jgi:hypothetical protein
MGTIVEHAELPSVFEGLSRLFSKSLRKRCRRGACPIVDRAAVALVSRLVLRKGRRTGLEWAREDLRSVILNRGTGFAFHKPTICEVSQSE